MENRECDWCGNTLDEHGFCMNGDCTRNKIPKREYKNPPIYEPTWKDFFREIWKEIKSWFRWGKDR